MQGDKLEAIKTWPSPNHLTEMRTFIGISACYRRFVEDFSSITAALFQLMKGVQWEWTKEYQGIVF